MKIALIQHAPVWYDLEASMAKAEVLIAEAAAAGARWTLFGESWLSGYPAWLDHCPNAALWDHEATRQLYGRMLANSPMTGGAECQRLAELARSYHIGIVMGLNERMSSGSLYNAVWTFDPEGNLANHHRKLMPTYTERLVHAQGDAAGLTAVRDQSWKIGTLICWEHWMPLARQRMHLEAEDLHVAVWPWVHDMHQVASRSYAFEGRCFVASVGQIMAVKDLPGELYPSETLAATPEKLLLRGGSCVVAPNGQYVAEPHLDEETIIYANLDMRLVRESKLTLDVAGHYSRPDIFTLHTDTERRTE